MPDVRPKIDLLSEEYIAHANGELKTKACLSPTCTVVGQGAVSVKYLATDGALAGMQEKYSAVKYLHYECTACGVKARLSSG